LNAFSGVLLNGEEQIVFYAILVYAFSRGFPDAGASFSLVCSALIHRRLYREKNGNLRSHTF
jgi:hypothetical protein